MFGELVTFTRSKMTHTVLIDPPIRSILHSSWCWVPARVAAVIISNLANERELVADGQVNHHRRKKRGNRHLSFELRAHNTPRGIEWLLLYLVDHFFFLKQLPAPGMKKIKLEGTESHHLPVWRCIYTLKTKQETCQFKSLQHFLWWCSLELWLSFLWSSKLTRWINPSFRREQYDHHQEMIVYKGSPILFLFSFPL